MESPSSRGKSDLYSLKAILASQAEFLSLPGAELPGAESLPLGPLSAARPAVPPTEGELVFSLDGQAIICACPDCGAPMSVRVWLMLADCWRCGCSLELTEEQELQVQRLLERPSEPRERLVNAPGVSSPPLTTAKTVTSDRESRRNSPPRTPTESRFRGVAPSPAPNVTDTRRPVPVAPQHESPRTPDPAPTATASRRQLPRSSWLSRLLGSTPAWLVSFVIHLVLLLILALVSFEEEHRSDAITLSTFVGPRRETGEVNAEIDPADELSHVQLLPDNLDLKDKKFREAILAADQLARELRIDPNSVDSQLPDLGRIKEWAASTDPIRRSLAVRDPRFRVQVAKQEGATTLTEAAVARALRWLAKEQHGDGHWETREKPWNHVETSLALLPFLGAGQTPTAGFYKDTVSKGLRWLVTHQKPDGDLRGGTGEQPGMYGHGIAAIVLCDAYGLTGDEYLRGPAQRALDFVVTAQAKDGGWRYHPGQPGDTSVVGWQLMALQSGRMSGLKVPDETLGLASHFLDTVSHEMGSRYAYQPGNRATPTMTAEGLLCRMYLGWRKDDPGLTHGIQWLLQEHLPNRNESNAYYWYYATQVYHHYGDEAWRTWNEKMRDVLVASQIDTGPNAGSWDPHGDPWGRTGGRIFQTSLSACTLEVYYRHAPIYRKISLD